MILQKSIKVNNLNEIIKQIEAYNVQGFKCPNCGSEDFVYYGKYKRFLIVMIDNEKKEELVEIKRVKCKDCGRTHAILPDFIIPYKQHILMYVNDVLNAKINKKKTNREICIKYGVTRQLLLRWLKQIKIIRSRLEVMNKTNENDNISFATDVYDYYNQNRKIYLMMREGSYGYAST